MEFPFCYNLLFLTCHQYNDDSYIQVQPEWTQKNTLKKRLSNTVTRRPCCSCISFTLSFIWGNSLFRPVLHKLSESFSISLLLLWSSNFLNTHTKGQEVMFKGSSLWMVTFLSTDIFFTFSTSKIVNWHYCTEHIE